MFSGWGGPARRTGDSQKGEADDPFRRKQGKRNSRIKKAQTARNKSTNAKILRKAGCKVT